MAREKFLFGLPHFIETDLLKRKKEKKKKDVFKRNDNLSIANIFFVGDIGNQSFNLEKTFSQH